MSIPKATVWARENTYPAGPDPWASQVCKVAPTGDLWLPGIKPPAEWRNYLDNSRWLESQATLDAICQSALNRWNPASPTNTIYGSSATDVADMKWDPFRQRWITVLNASNDRAFASYDSGLTWSQWGPNLGVGLQAVAISSVDGSMVMGGVVTGNGFAVFLPANGGGITTTSGLTGLNGTTAMVGKFFAGLFILYGAAQSGGSFTGGAYKSSDGTTFTALTLPGAFASGTNHVGQVLATQNDSPAKLLIAICGATAGSDVAKVMSSSDGSTYADVTPAAVSGKIITGLHYSADMGLYGILAYDGTSSYLFTSTDAVTWGTATKIFSNIRADGLGSVGQIWTVSLVASGLRRLAYSNDLQDTRWSWAPGLSGFAESSGVARMQNNGNQVALWNGANAAISSQAGSLPGSI